MNKNSDKYMIVSLDFDGTLVRTDNFPVFDPTPLPGLMEALTWMKENLDAKFILLTQRDHDHVYNPILGKAVRRKPGDLHSTVLQTAINWCKDHGIELYAVNDNPSQRGWSTSKKVYSDLIIDDRSLLPLDENDCVDWIETLKLIKKRYGK
jgi:hypothetical protein